MKIAKFIIFLIISFLMMACKSEKEETENRITEKFTGEAYLNPLKNSIDVNEIDLYAIQLNLDSTQNMVQKYQFKFIENDTNLIATASINLNLKQESGIYRFDSIFTSNKEYYGLFDINLSDESINSVYKTDSITIETFRFGITSCNNINVVTEEVVKSGSSTKQITKTYEAVTQLSCSFYIKLITALKDVQYKNMRLKKNHLYQIRTKSIQPTINDRYKGILIGLGKMNELIEVRAADKVVFNSLGILK